MRPYLIVLPQPLFYQHLVFTHIGEDLPIQRFVSQFAVDTQLPRRICSTHPEAMSYLRYLSPTW